MQAALRSTGLAVRSQVLQRFRVGVTVENGVYWRFQAALGEDGFATRGYSSEAHGTYLDKKMVTDRVLSVVKSMEKVDHSKVTPHAHFQNDLGLDSLDTVELVMAIEEEFAVEIPDTEADKILSTASAIEYIASMPLAK